jgi:hypothetical protein
MISGLGRFARHWREFVQPVIVVGFAGTGGLIGATNGLTGAIIGGVVGSAFGLVLAFWQAAHDAMNELEPFDITIEAVPPSSSTQENFPSHQANLVTESKLAQNICMDAPCACLRHPSRKTLFSFHA